MTFRHRTLYQLSYDGLTTSQNSGGQGRIRTFVPRKEGQIYSLLALTTHPPVRCYYCPGFGGPLGLKFIIAKAPNALE
jgi:hypothetical protein